MSRCQLLISLSLILSVSFIDSQVISDPGQPYEDWLFECKPTQAIGSAFTRRVDSDYGIDWEITVTCWEIDNFAPVDVSESDCSWAEDFQLGADVSLGTPANCEAGSFVSGLRGNWDGEKRMVASKCCKPVNAIIDTNVGCHTSPAIDINVLDQAALETPYEHAINCPNWVVTGFESCGGGVKVLYCPFKVESSEYDIALCRAPRTTGVELCPSTPYKDWNMQCSPTQTLGGFYSARIETGYGTDYQFTFFCRDINEDGKTKVSEDDCRWADEFQTGNTVEYTDSVNCVNKNEYASGVRGFWDDAAQARTIQFKCCTAENVRLARQIGCHATELTNTFSLTEFYSGTKSPYEPRFKCPRYVWTSMKSCGQGIQVKFCPYQVDGEDYETDVCKKVRTTDFDPDELCPPPPPPPKPQCAIIPWGNCEKQCDADADCFEEYGEQATCCNNGCADVCFVGVPCTDRKCFGTRYCPVNCYDKCSRYFDANFEAKNYKRMLGWECAAKNKLTNADCCCEYESSDPNCLIGESSFLRQFLKK